MNAKQTNIIFIASLLSKSRLHDMFAMTGKDPGFAIQKFNRLVVEGFKKNGINVTVLSSHPYARGNKMSSVEEENGIIYKYLPLINYPIIKHLFQAIYVFFYTFFFGVVNRKNKFIVCDVLCVSSSLAAMFASKINGIKTIAIVTDVPNHNWSGEKSWAGSINLWMIKQFDMYVLLTEQMNKVVNPKQKPYVVMEGIVDENVNICKHNKEKERIVLYAGGVNRLNGVNILVEAFRGLSDKNVYLDIYGSGDYKEELLEICSKNRNIRYKGVKGAEEIFQAEQDAILLANPRPLEGEYIMYSFPSKNMEYMQSGTPLITTPLPCIPNEYSPYLYYFPSHASVEGYRTAIEEILKLSNETLIEKGMSAQSFVNQTKNNKVQTEKIIIKLFEEGSNL